MSKLTWDAIGERFYETGVKNVVLYPVTGSAYGNGVAWNGVTAINESPTGGEANPLFADDIKYLNMISAEQFGASIEAYTYPDEFAECDGSATLATGITVGQQTRKMFGLSYVTSKGNDTVGDSYGYKIHIVYGATASPSDKGYNTMSEDPEAITFSWDITTTPVEVGAGFKPTSHLIIDSNTVPAETLTQIKDSLYGTANSEPTILMPDDIVDLINGD